MKGIRVRSYASENWRFLIGLTITTVFVLTVLFWRLGSLTPGFSVQEKIARGQSHTISVIQKNPVNAPHKILQYALQKTGHRGPLAMRSVSVLFGIVAIICFYRLSGAWFSPRVAILTSICFASCPALIINARNGTTDILLATSLSLLIATYLWMLKARHSIRLAVICFFIAVSISLYTPGLTWILLLGSFFFGRYTWKLLRGYNKRLPYIFSLLFLLISTPLIWASVYDHNVAKEILLLPTYSMPLGDSIVAIIWSGAGVLWRTRTNLPTTLGFEPMLNVLGVIMVVFGASYLAREYARRRTYAIFSILLLITIASGLRENFQIMLLGLPLFFVLFGAGLEYLFKEWFSVFPRNPIAKQVAITLVVAIVSVNVFYGVHYSLTAWPRSPETKHLYMLQ